MVASIYICERRFLVAHWPLCYGVNVDTKDVLNGEGNMYLYSAALVGSRAVVHAIYICVARVKYVRSLSQPTAA